MFNKLKTIPTPNNNGSYGIKGGVRMPYFGVRMPCFLYKSLGFEGLLCHTDPRYMAYVGGIIFANMGGGSGQKCRARCACESDIRHLAKPVHHATQKRPLLKVASALGTRFVWQPSQTHGAETRTLWRFCFDACHRPRLFGL